MKDGVFISVWRLCHKACHTLPSIIFSWDRGSYLGNLLCAWWSFDCVCVCVCGTSTVHTGGVGETRAGVPDPRGKSWLQRGLSSSLALVGLLGKPGIETVGWGGGDSVEANEQKRCWAGSCPLPDRIWSMSCRQGSRPSLRTQTYLQCICWAACAVRLSPLRATSVFLLGVRGGWWEDRGRKGERWGRCRGGERGARSREGQEGAQCETAPAEACQVAELYGKHELPPG